MILYLFGYNNNNDNNNNNRNAQRYFKIIKKCFSICSNEVLQYSLWYGYIVSSAVLERNRWFRVSFLKIMNSKMELSN